MKKETQKQRQQLRLYYHLILFGAILLIVTNLLLFLSLFQIDGNERFVAILDQLNNKLAYFDKPSTKSHEIQLSDQLHVLDLFEYSSEFKLWTITTRKNYTTATASVINRFKARYFIAPKQSSTNLNQYETAQCDLTIWPNTSNSLKSGQSVVIEQNDRIIEQLTYQPQCLFAKNIDSRNHTEDTILKIKPDRLDLESDRSFFIQEGCTVDKCEITYDWNQADALIFKNFKVDFIPEEYVRTEKQIWIAHTLESPTNIIRERLQSRFIFNWTATYRRDSDIVTPYEKFVPYSETIKPYQLLTNMSYKDKKSYYLDAGGDIKKLIRNKKKNIVWFVSNCFTANHREKYVDSLSEYIDIDVYGRCGNLKCLKANHTNCLQMANEKYRFYVAFENSEHTDYITEKLFNNGLGKNDLNHMMIPIVMGTSKTDYLKQAPKSSFIHIDDFDSPKELAKLLTEIANDEVLFHSYFIWKSMGKFIDTKFYCRVCTMLHHSRRNNLSKYYSDINQWFTNENDSSRKTVDLLSAI